MTIIFQQGASNWQVKQTLQPEELGSSRATAPTVLLSPELHSSHSLCGPMHAGSVSQKKQSTILPVEDNRAAMAARLLSFSKPSAEEDVFLWGRAERYERLRLQQVQQMHHTPGIHFDKHSLRWKATWYDISGHRKAKYFPIGKPCLRANVLHAD